jgi:hypothetical protein
MTGLNSASLTSHLPFIFLYYLILCDGGSDFITHLCSRYELLSAGFYRIVYWILWHLRSSALIVFLVQLLQARPGRDADHSPLSSAEVKKE